MLAHDRASSLQAGGMTWDKSERISTSQKVIHARGTTNIVCTSPASNRGQHEHGKVVCVLVPTAGSVHPIDLLPDRALLGLTVNFLPSFSQLVKKRPSCLSIFRLGTLKPIVSYGSHAKRRYYTQHAHQRRTTVAVRGSRFRETVQQQG